MIRLIAALLLAASACSGSGGGSGMPEVVAAFYPLADAAQAIGGSGVIVHDLTPAGVEPHDVELKPSDFGRLRSADLILYLGGGFQPALVDAIDALPDRRNAIDLLEGLPLLPSDEPDQPSDPHVWLDPLHMGRIVLEITSEMVVRAPFLEDPLQTNTQRYLDMLDELHEDYERTLSTCRRREIVTAHAAFGYLAARYGLEQIPIAISPEVEPTPRQLEDVARLARDHGVTTIYFEPLVSRRVVETVARSVGAKTAVLNPIEGLTDEEQRSGDNYLSLMRANLAALAEGLDCKLT